MPAAYLYHACTLATLAHVGEAAAPWRLAALQGTEAEVVSTAATGNVASLAPFKTRSSCRFFPVAAPSGRVVNAQVVSKGEHVSDAEAALPACRFLAYFTGDDSEISLDTEHREFKQWQW